MNHQLREENYLKEEIEEIFEIHLCRYERKVNNHLYFDNLFIVNGQSLEQVTEEISNETVQAQKYYLEKAKFHHCLSGVNETLFRHRLEKRNQELMRKTEKSIIVCDSNSVDKYWVDRWLKNQSSTLESKIQWIIENHLRRYESNVNGFIDSIPLEWPAVGKPTLKQAMERISDETKNIQRCFVEELNTRRISPKRYATFFNQCLEKRKQDLMERMEDILIESNLHSLDKHYSTMLSCVIGKMLTNGL